MPVRLPSNDDPIGQFNRLSASQVNTYRSCPRLWFYEKVWRFKMPQIPILSVGKAVEEAVCKVLRESPALIVEAAGTSVLDATPLGEDDLPMRDGGSWPADRLLPLPDDMIPSEMSELKEWATSRVNLHLPIALREARKAWENDPRKAGSWDDVDVNRCHLMAHRALEYHLNEVQACLDANGGPSLEGWRAGARPLWPSPDGRRFQLVGKHPLAKSGAATLTECWEIARPWFVDPNTANFTMNSVHPQHWFQGEYDLVYRWNGKIKIVDLKASSGSHDRSGDYVEQLRMYAMLWWACGEKQEIPDELEIWYLGNDSIKTVEVPSKEELEEMEDELNLMWHDLREVAPSIEDCPAEPSLMRHYAPGGNATGETSDTRCDSCDWRGLCERGEGDWDSMPEGGSVHLPGQATPLNLTPIGVIQDGARVNYAARVRRAIKGKYSIMEYELDQGRGVFSKVEVKSDTTQDGSKSYPDEVKSGDILKVENAIFTKGYNGLPVFKIEPHSRVIHGTEADLADSDLFKFNMIHNFKGRFVYRYLKSGEKKNGMGRWYRKGMMLADKTGSIMVEGWDNAFDSKYDNLEVGDEVTITGIALDGWAVNITANYDNASNMYVKSK